ncbi:alpha/beta fold hydrolase [Paenibacillus sp. KQZ6P-2]|uniref:Alpha/beta fold hydrolase n=1 Tax=Paenibacillus mangrovi TaxID=2931978 RepID=A0A9X2B504_9BACL|nr:alpha/beta fold hydrolase [Paenibacillus mangrovi]MCJ8014550.1 alpha/beta fold hydrolase [Paenibacillus mangrovi]
MTERMLHLNGMDICTESFGDPKDPAVLLIMGATASMIWWEVGFCKSLAAAGRFVIRYDHRDTGRSVTYPPGQPEYSFEDMADDAIHVLDGYGVAKAHVAGMSMGGMLTQMIALRHPERVESVTLFATSNFAPGLPPSEEKVDRFFETAGEVDWTSERSVVQFSVEKWRVLRGSKHAFDERNITLLAEQEFRRSLSPASMMNHGLVSGGETYLGRTAEIHVPALIIHGTEDPIIPYEHGIHLADVIPDSRLLTLEGTGHELHAGDWETIIQAIAGHTAS